MLVHPLHDDASASVSVAVLSLASGSMREEGADTEAVWPRLPVAEGLIVARRL